jgi:hypothetical protein
MPSPPSRPPQSPSRNAPIAARIVDPAAVGQLARLERDPDRQRRLLALLLEQDDRQSMRVFLRRVEDPQTSDAALGAVELAARVPVEKLLESLSGPDRTRRTAAARVLGRLNRPEVSRQLIEMVLRGTSRHEALVALLASPEASARRFLAGAVRDPVLSVSLWNAQRQLHALAQGRS